MFNINSAHPCSLKYLLSLNFRIPLCVRRCAAPPLLSPALVMPPCTPDVLITIFVNLSCLIHTQKFLLINQMSQPKGCSAISRKRTRPRIIG